MSKGGREEATTRENECVSEGWKQAIKRIREVGTRRASQGGRRQNTSERASRGSKKIFVFVVLLFYVHGKHLRSCRDGQLT